jgi:acetyl-CoA synthetase
LTKCFQTDPVYKKYVIEEFDENGLLNKFSIDEEKASKFNFAFDCVDVMAEKSPDKTAMMWVAKDGVTEHRFTFAEMKTNSNKAANYLKSLGIGKGDRVMLVLKRHYQFEFLVYFLNFPEFTGFPAHQHLCNLHFSLIFSLAGNL